MDVTIAEEEDPAQRRRIVETLTARLPQWFGRPEANRRYAAQAQVLEAWVARVDGGVAGLLLLARHDVASAEIRWLAVDPTHHRRGLGRRLVGAVECRLRQDEAKFLFVATLHPDDSYEPYRRTRAFYEALGFSFALPAAGSSADPDADRLAWYLKPL